METVAATGAAIFTGGVGVWTAKVLE